MDSQPKAGPDPREPSSNVRCQRCGGTKSVRVCTRFMFSCHELNMECDCEPQPCRECNGTGEVNDDHGGNIGVVKHCSWCGGTGIYRGKDTNDVGECFWCGGVGKR